MQFSPRVTSTIQPCNTPKSLCQTRLEQLKKELFDYDKNYLRWVDAHALSRSLSKKYAFPEIQQRGAVELLTQSIYGFDDLGNTTTEIQHVAVTMRIPVVHHEMMPSMLEATSKHVFTPASTIRYSPGTITLEAMANKTQLRHTVEHLKADIQKRNLRIRKENDALARMLETLIETMRKN